MFSIVTRNRKAAEVAVHFVHSSMNVIKESQVQEPKMWLVRTLNLSLFTDGKKYKYLAKTGTCQRTKFPSIHKGSQFATMKLSGDEIALKNLVVKHGPIVVVFRNLVLISSFKQLKIIFPQNQNILV